VSGVQAPVRVTVQSGSDLEVDLKDERGVVRGVLLGGPAEFVFAGRIAL
jgi:diaminopimelate epimerase